MKKINVFIYALYLIVFMSCANRSDSHVDYKGVEMATETLVESADEETKTDAQPALTDETLAKAEPSVVEKKILKDGDLDIQVADYAKSRAEIERIVKGNGGYISQENQTDDGYRLHNQIELRLPSDNFDKTVEAIEAIAQRVERKSINARDVTAEFVDIESRLRAKKETRLKYEGFLKNAKNVSEIMEIENQLRQITEEIEAKEGQLKYLNDRVAMSTLRLNLYAELPYKHYRRNASGPSFWQRIGDGVQSGWSGLLSFVVAMLTLWPLFLGLGVVFFMFRRWRKTRNS